MSVLLDARDKLDEIKARLAALQALFFYQGKDKQFGYSACWGIDLTIGTIVDDLGDIEQSLATVKEHNQGGQSPTD